MTVNEWLKQRRPRPPAALVHALQLAVGVSGNEEDADTVNACLSAGEQLVMNLLARNCTQRDSALELLTADALVTYAFEAAAEYPSTLVKRGNDAMRRIARLAGNGSQR